MMKFKRNLFLTGVVLAAAALVIAAGFTTADAAKAQKAVILATTTSTQDSGLLDVLIPMFEKKTGYFVKTIAVGSGQAMAMGAKGEADVLLVHSPAAEKKFMADGNGVKRRIVMHNDFIIVGRRVTRPGSRERERQPTPSRRSPPRGASSCPAATNRGPT